MKKSLIVGTVLGSFFTIFVMTNLWRLPSSKGIPDGKGPSYNTPGAIFWCHHIGALGPNAPQKNYDYNCTATETVVNSVENFVIYTGTIAYVIVMAPVAIAGSLVR